jgi:hypothetical protein
LVETKSKADDSKDNSNEDCQTGDQKNVPEVVLVLLELLNDQGEHSDYGPNAEKGSQKEEQEVMFVVSLSDATADHRTVVVVLLHTTVAELAVVTTRRPGDIASHAKFELEKWLSNCHAIQCSSSFAGVRHFATGRPTLSQTWTYISGNKARVFKGSQEEEDQTGQLHCKCRIVKVLVGELN